MRVKCRSILVLVLALTLISGCAGAVVGDPTPGAESKPSVASAAPVVTDSTAKDIENLPEELYIARDFDTDNKSLSAHYLGYGFSIESKTEFSIAAEIVLGELSLSIKNKDNDEVLFKEENIKTIDDSLTLEEGSYSVILSGRLSNGYIHITGKPIDT